MLRGHSANYSFGGPGFTPPETMEIIESEDSERHGYSFHCVQPALNQGSDFRLFLNQQLMWNRTKI